MARWLWIYSSLNLHLSADRAVYANPKVVWQHRVRGAHLDVAFAEGRGRLRGGVAMQHGGMDKANIGGFAVFLTIVNRCPLDFGKNLSLGVIVKP